MPLLTRFHPAAVLWLGEMDVALPWPRCAGLARPSFCSWLHAVTCGRGVWLRFLRNGERPATRHTLTRMPFYAAAHKIMKAMSKNAPEAPKEGEVSQVRLRTLTFLIPPATRPCGFSFSPPYTYICICII